jgi:hypothetical protein
MKLGIILTFCLIACEGPHLPYAKQIGQPIGAAVIPDKIPMQTQNFTAPLSDFRTYNAIPPYSIYSATEDVAPVMNMDLLLYKRYGGINAKWQTPFTPTGSVPMNILPETKMNDKYYNNEVPEGLW